MPHLTTTASSTPSTSSTTIQYSSEVPTTTKGCQGVSLSLSSAAFGQAACAPALIGQLPPETAAPPRTGPVPAGPFTGYAAILKGSRFLRPAQQLLEEACGGSGTTLGAMVYSDGELESLDLAVDDGGGGGGGETRDGVIRGGEHHKMKSRLISMLDEFLVEILVKRGLRGPELLYGSPWKYFADLIGLQACRRYKQYCQQIQAVVASFDAVEGLNTAASYTPMALGSLSKHFKCIQTAISDQLRFTNKALGKKGQSTDEMPRCRVMNGGLCCERVAHGLGAIDPQPVWRPQRGLPECAVAMLRAWLFEHFLHPYPTDLDKQMLAKQTGLSRNQVSNWFINARVRLWKPMVEEIHSLELQQAHKIPETDTNNHTKFSSTSTVNPNNKQIPINASSQKIPDHPHKPLCDELPQLPNHIKEPVNFSCVDLSAHHPVGVTAGFASGAASGTISLTLGLQNEGVCLPEPLPLNVVQRFGLEGNSAAFIMGGFEGQERHLSKEFDGEFLRHFVA